ncbi:MAG: hypothetical protein ACLP59_11230 [Bryobacteraceae bacterium]
MILQIDPGADSQHEAAQACQQLYLDLKMSAPEADIAKQQTQGIAEHRELITVLSTLVVSGIKLGVFSGMFQAVKTWLDNRPTAEVTLKAKDGSELKISKVTPEQAFEFFKQHDLGNA